MFCCFFLFIVFFSVISGGWGGGGGLFSIQLHLTFWVCVFEDTLFKIGLKFNHRF